VFVPHPLDLIAILLGIFLALRGSDIRAEDPALHPGVSPLDFQRWKERALFAYRLGARACFAKVVIDFGFVALLRRVTLDLTLQRTLGVALDLAWVVAMLACWVLARRARKLGEGLGIRIGAAPQAADEPSSTAEERSASTD